MFKFLKKDSGDDGMLYAIAEGKAIKIEEVNDQMFAEKMLGDGVAFQFDGDTVYAPADCTVVMIAATKHAIGVQTKSAEILIHIGLDTVKFDGKGFDVLVSEGEKVKRGQALIKLDRDFFNAEGIDMTTPMIITATEKSIKHGKVGDVTLESVSLTIE